VAELIAIAHELGNVTTAIKLNLSVLEEKGDHPANLHEHLHDLESARHLIACWANSGISEESRGDGDHRPAPAPCWRCRMCARQNRAPQSPARFFYAGTRKSLIQGHH